MPLQLTTTDATHLAWLRAEISYGLLFLHQASSSLFHQASIPLAGADAHGGQQVFAALLILLPYHGNSTDSAVDVLEAFDFNAVCALLYHGATGQACMQQGPV